MLTGNEIISTLEMLKNENLDVRTVTLGINLLDCAGADLNEVRRRVAERVMGLAGRLVPVCDGSAASTGSRSSTSASPSARSRSWAALSPAKWSSLRARWTPPRAR